MLTVRSTDGIYSSKDYVFIAKVGSWGTGKDKDSSKEVEIISLILDCEKWKLNFFQNGKSVATISIKEGLTYYPSISQCGGCKDHEINLKLMP